MGLLSQALTNAKSAEAQIASLAGLPEAAKTIQAASTVQIAQIVPRVEQNQTAVASFVAAAREQLQQAAKEAAGTGPLSTVKELMLQVQQAAKRAQSSVDSIKAEVTGVSEAVFGYSSQLSPIVSQLNEQKARLKGQLAGDRSELESKRRFYNTLLVLSPLGGVVGLAAAFAAYQSWQSKVSDSEAAMSALSAKITALSNMVAHVGQLESDFENLATKLSGVNNSIGFLATDVSQVTRDLEDTPATRKTIAVYITAASNELETVASDAS